MLPILPILQSSHHPVILVWDGGMRVAIEFTSGLRPVMCEAERSKPDAGTVSLVSVLGCKDIVKVPYPTLPTGRAHADVLIGTGPRRPPKDASGIPPGTPGVPFGIDF